jgi:hypothetical protein
MVSRFRPSTVVPSVALSLLIATAAYAAMTGRESTSRATDVHNGYPGAGRRTACVCLPSRNNDACTS